MYDILFLLLVSHGLVLPLAFGILRGGYLEGFGLRWHSRRLRCFDISDASSLLLRLPHNEGEFCTYFYLATDVYRTVWVACT